MTSQDVRKKNFRQTTKRAKKNIANDNRDEASKNFLCAAYLMAAAENVLKIFSISIWKRCTFNLYL